MKKITLFVTENLTHSLERNDKLKTVLRKGEKIVIIAFPAMHIMLRQGNVKEVIFDLTVKTAKAFAKTNGIKTGVFREDCQIIWLNR